MPNQYKIIDWEFVNNKFKERGYNLLDDKYINAHTKMKYLCDKGHQSEITWNNFKKGAGCFLCNGKIKPDFNYVKSKFEERNYTLLSDQYINAKTKLKYRCPNGHEGEITWDKFYNRNDRCKKCLGMEKHTLDFISKEFEKEGYILLAKDYKNAHQQLQFICPNNHRGRVNYNKFQQGDRCRLCYFERNRGENNPNWNPNLTDQERQAKRDYQEYENWRISVFKRDNRECQCCGSKKKINAHHIYNYSSHPELRVDINNGITLCEHHHSDFHKKYGFKYNTKSQLDEYLVLAKEALIKAQKEAPCNVEEINQSR